MKVKRIESPYIDSEAAKDVEDSGVVGLLADIAERRIKKIMDLLNDNADGKHNHDIDRLPFAVNKGIMHKKSFAVAESEDEENDYFCVILLALFDDERASVSVQVGIDWQNQQLENEAEVCGRYHGRGYKIPLTEAGKEAAGLIIEHFFS